MGKTNLPAIRCETFIEAFEKAVHAAQQKVKKLEGGQLEYIACSEVLRRLALPNDGELALTEQGATITVMALPTDSFSTFERAAAMLGTELVERKLHRDGVPAVNLEGVWQAQAVFTFRTQRRDGTIGTCEMNVHVPPAGLIDMRIDETERPYSLTVMRLIPRSGDQPAPSDGTAKPM